MLPEYREIALVGLIVTSAFVAWLPFAYALIYAKVRSIKSRLKFSPLCTFVAYGVSGLFGATIGLPIAILFINVLPQACETNPEGMLCRTFPLLEMFEGAVYWALVVLTVLMAPYITKRYFWFK